MWRVNQPILVPRADQATVTALRTALKIGFSATGGTAAVTTVGVIVLAVLNRRDERFLDVAPGTTDPHRKGVGPDNKPKIPVRFVPPDLPVAMAGLLEDGSVDVRDTTAALLSLAVRGAIQLRQEDQPKRGIFGRATSSATMYARQVRTDVPMAPHEAKLIKDIFHATPLGIETVLTGRGTLYLAHWYMQAKVKSAARKARLYKRMPGTSMAPGVSALMSVTGTAAWLFAWVLGICAAMVAEVLATVGIRALVVVGPLVVLIVGYIGYGVLTYRGRRSALGRAYTDQIVGFRDYIASVEADQIKFEEGQDIFSQYLPWAVIFNLTDRWTKVCAQLMQMGRLADQQPNWYYGGSGTFNTFVFTSSLGSVNQASMSSFSGSGSGGGSSFGGGGGFSGGGGGFSGGGGGGGGVGSW